MPKTTEFSAFVSELQLLQLSLDHLQNQLCEDLELAPGPRAILEWIAENPGKTVPDIAKLRHVSRQHIQVQINALYDRGFVEALANEAHARSYLYQLSKDGQKVYKTIKARLELATESIANQIELSQVSTVVAQIQEGLKNIDLDSAVQAAKKKHKL